MRELFRKFAKQSSETLGSPEVFLAAIATILLWGTLGPALGYSDTWQLVINTATSVLTFLMVFIIQNTQNRDAKAIQLKLDELIRGVEGARTGLVKLEDLSEAELATLTTDFERLRVRLARAGDGPRGPAPDGSPLEPHTRERSETERLQAR